MQIPVKEGGSYNLKQVVKQHLDTYNMTLDVEAKFFINLITQHVDYKISQRSRFSYRPPRRRRVDRSQTTLKTEIEIKLENAYNTFSKKLIENSSGKRVTTHDLYVTLNGLCPLWPFC